MFKPLACCHKAIWVHPYAVCCYTGQVGPRFGDSWSLVMWEWCNNVMVEADVHLSLLSTCTFDVYKVCLSHWYAVSRPYGCTLMLLQRPSCPRFGNSGSLVEWKWCHRVMVEADIHLRPLHTYKLVDVYTVFEPLVCCLKAIRVHPYTTVTLAKLTPDLGIQIHLWSENVAIVSCFRLISTSDLFIHPMDTSKVFDSLVYWVSRAYGCTLISFHLPAK